MSDYNLSDRRDFRGYFAGAEKHNTWPRDKFGLANYDRSERLSTHVAQHAKIVAEQTAIIELDARRRSKVAEEIIRAIEGVR